MAAKVSVEMVKQMAAQGDVVLRRVKEMPKGVRELARDGGNLVVAHSETGHHHVVKAQEAQLFAHPTDPFLSYLKLPPKTDSVDLEHLRPWDTHATLRLLGSMEGEVVYEVRRQREESPWGTRAVAD